MGGQGALVQWDEGRAVSGMACHRYARQGKVPGRAEALAPRSVREAI